MGPLLSGAGGSLPRVRQRAKILPHEDHPGPDSLSSNDVHSKAKCILHSVRLAL